MKKDKWIWLDPGIYPGYQTTRLTPFSGSTESYTVAEFTRKYTFSSEPVSMRLRFSADTVARLYVNGESAVNGPVSVGGDFLDNRPDLTPYWQWFANELTVVFGEGEDDRAGGVIYLPSRGCELDFYARVQLMPTSFCDFSKGHGGLLVLAEVTLKDGRVEEICTDESWLSRRLTAYTSFELYDETKTEDLPLTHAVVTRDIWQAKTASIPTRVENLVYPEGGCGISVAANTVAEMSLHFPKIIAGYLSLDLSSLGEVEIEVLFRELVDDTAGTDERLILKGSGTYTGLKIHSAGTLYLKVQNRADTPCTLDVGLVETYLPSCLDASTVTSDVELNEILANCKRSLKYCRQYIHLDSPRHLEPLACTGDYYIETLMSAFSYADMSLAKLDCYRTAELILGNGRMFHTTYSLIWVRMIHDVYMMTGDLTVLESCREALDALLSMFDGYACGGGIIDNPHDYMFVDWIYIDGYTLHHPPKALGQSALNMFYYGALDAAEKIYAALGDKDAEDATRAKKNALKEAINERLYDKERGLYFEGENTPTPRELIGEWQPENTDKRYYRINANALAATFGVADKDRARRILVELLSDEDFSDYQPYFAHFVLEAIFKNGLYEEWTMPIIDRWREQHRICPKGLAEGFLPPEPGYRFDHSHAWGGTPLYSLPLALIGLEILEPGMTKLRLSPRLLGLEWARIELPTPKGMVTVEQRRGEKAKITAPDGVTIVI
jgi:hypothetical protein